MEEFNFEEGEQVNLNNLRSSFLPKEIYRKAHENLVIFCHDIIIEYGEGFLLVFRKKYPVKNIPWPIGGRVEKGLLIEESVRKKVKEECNLDLIEIKELGVARTFFKTDPFGHGKGTDSINIMFFAKAKGKLKLDEDHENIKILTRDEYNSGYREKLHPYVQYMIDLSVKN